MGRKEKIVEIKIQKVLYPNVSIGEYEGKTVKLKGGIEGQKVRAKITRRRKEYYEARILEVVEKSPLEKIEGCPHKDVCGGCTYQSLTYDDELELKNRQIRALFEKENIELDGFEILPSPRLTEYRNKMEYTFGDEGKDTSLSLGLHIKGKIFEVVNTDYCNIVDEDFTKIRDCVRKYFSNLNLPYYNTRSHEGFLRHLVIRKALSTGEILVNLVTTSTNNFIEEDFIKSLLSVELSGNIVGIIHTINDGLADVVKADKIEILYGRDYIKENIMGLNFKVSPFSFFQTNTFGAEKLYETALNFVTNIEGKTVLDLYSGTGTIAQIMAKKAKKVIGIEIVEEAVKMAKENAKLNNITNVEFIAGDVLEKIENIDIKPDLVVLDPPRDGIHPKAIGKIIEYKPKEFLYISCNPVTLVRDIKIFNENGYKLEKVKCVDMFPRTSHVECVVLMSRVEK
jgi:23S rRNA m(5)U-1939 methyltransferase (EC 2.1.1.-)